jgi:uncharacterized OsmC-like protein
MHSISGKYKGSLRTESLHIKSNNLIITDAPTDNNGKGEAFSPTDLLCSSLASCMITIVGIAAQTHSINIDGVSWEIIKVMGVNPRRVVEIGIKFNFPKNNYSQKEMDIIKLAALNCPVAKSLNPEVKLNIEFVF